MKYGDYIQFNSADADINEIAQLQFHQLLQTIAVVGKTVTDGKIEFSYIEPIDGKYDKAIKWVFEVNKENEI